MAARIVVVAFVLGLVLCPAAFAKGLPIEVEVCGAGGCVDRTAGVSHALLMGGPRREALRRDEPYYVVRLGFGRGDMVFHRIARRWFPASGALLDDVWMRPNARTRRALERLTRGIEPLPAGSPSPVALPDPVTGQLPPQTMNPPAPRQDGGGGGPSSALVAAPAVALLGLVALAGLRRRRRD